jgi:hypothetical protein
MGQIWTFIALLNPFIHPSRDLFPHSVLDFLQTKKNLVSIHHFTNDNNAFVEYHPNFFFLGQGFGQRQSFYAPDVEMISIPLQCHHQ